MTETRVTIKDQPDEFGFIYGSVSSGEGGASMQFDIMPPEADWQGGQRLPGFEPHQTDWVVYVDGEVVARVRSLDEVKQKMLGG